MAHHESQDGRSQRAQVRRTSPPAEPGADGGLNLSGWANMPGDEVVGEESAPRPRHLRRTRRLEPSESVSPPHGLVVQKCRSPSRPLWCLENSPAGEKAKLVVAYRTATRARAPNGEGSVLATTVAVPRPGSSGGPAPPAPWHPAAGGVPPRRRGRCQEASDRAGRRGRRRRRRRRRHAVRRPNHDAGQGLTTSSRQRRRGSR